MRFCKDSHSTELSLFFIFRDSLKCDSRATIWLLWESSIRGNKAIDIIVTSLPWKFHARPFWHHSRLTLFFSSNAYSNILLCPGFMSEWLTSGRRLGFLNARKIDNGYIGFVKLQNGRTEINTQNDLNGIDFKL